MFVGASGCSPREYRSNQEGELPVAPMTQKIMAATQPHKQVKDIFTKPVLDKIASYIAEAEQGTSAESRVCIREERDHDEAGLPLEEIAKREFLKLGMEKTAGRNGILLLVL